MRKAGNHQRLAYELERRDTRVTISEDGKTAMVTGDLIGKHYPSRGRGSRRYRQR